MTVTKDIAKEMEKEKEKKQEVQKKTLDATSSRESTKVDNKSGDEAESRKQKSTKRRRIVRRRERARSEFDQKIISIRRVTRVMAGGRRFSFSVALVAGDRKGSVGVGTGKAADTALAIEKAARAAKKNMVKLTLTKEKRIPHDIKAKYCASRVWLSPAAGRGLVAGSSMRSVLELGGVKDVTGKILSRSKNKLNNARATIKALQTLKE